MKNILSHIFILAIIAVVVGYGFISVQAQSNGLTVTSNPNTDIIAQKFINQINILGSVNIDTSLLSQDSFKSFMDWSRPIPEEEKGRANPFAPIN
jgi:hypothetical protein